MLAFQEGSELCLVLFRAPSDFPGPVCVLTFNAGRAFLTNLHSLMCAARVLYAYTSCSCALCSCALCLWGYVCIMLTAYSFPSSSLLCATRSDDVHACDSFCLCDVLLAAQIDYSHPIVLYISARFVISPAGSVFF